MFHDLNSHPETWPDNNPACGATMTEYVLVMAAIVIVTLVAFSVLGTTITAAVNNVIVLF